MKSKLTPEQSQRLIELGVDPSKASATRYIISETEVYCGYSREVIVTDGYLTDYVSQEPLFTLSDILSHLPKEIMGIGLGMEHDDGLWCVYYNTLIVKSNPKLIDALFELFCWVLQNHPDKSK